MAKTLRSYFETVGREATALRTYGKVATDLGWSTRDSKLVTVHRILGPKSGAAAEDTVL